MKNDLDFMNDKLENSGVTAPADMDERYVLDTLADVQPQPVAVQKQPKRRGWKIALSATAAVLVVAITAGVAVNLRRGRIVGVTDIIRDSTDNIPLHRFQSRDEIKAAVKKIQSDREKKSLRDYIDIAGDVLYGALRGGGMVKEEAAAGDDYSVGGYDDYSENSFTSGSSDLGAAGDIGAESYSDTYTQVEGVDEADIIKTDGRYIYCVDNYSDTEIVIFSAAGENSERVATIDISEAFAETTDGATEDEAEPENDDFDYEGYYGWNDRYVNDIYVKGDRLIALCTDTDYTRSSSEGLSNSTLTDVLVYDIGDVGSITLLDRMAQSGYYASSRMIGDMLYTVSSYYVDDDDIIPLCGDFDKGATPDEIAADCVYSLEEPGSESFLVVSAYNTLDYTAQTQSKAILGAAEDIYCNTENLYIYVTRYEYHRDSFLSEFYTADVTSQILKVSLTDDLSFTAYTTVDGYIDDQYALDEYNGNLRVATTSTNEDGEDVNNLYVLDEYLGLLGSVTSFAEDESIQAVRYVGDTAYVITYEQTDPLFVLDLSDPTAPAILGEVKISGFSTMLVPIDENTLLGIGYHTENEDYTYLEVQEGVKLALFDVSDKANPQVLDSVSYIDCYSEVQYNPKALVYNPDRGDYIIPLNYAHFDWYDDFAGSDEELYGGMLNFKVENGKIVQIDRYAADFEDDIERCVYVGDTIYMIYHNGGRLDIVTTPYR